MEDSSKSINLSRSKQLLAEAKTLIPGGVNSPVRAFKSVGGNPPFMRSASGAWLTDEDGNRYIDLINSWGPMILGHAHPVIEAAAIAALKDSPSFGAPTAREIEMARLVTELVPSVEMVRMVNSGTEATLSAIRLARGATGRNKIIKFAGCYHGHADSFLIAAGSGALTFGIPDSAGVTPHTAEDTLTAEFNDLPGVQALLQANAGLVAAIIVEPVPGNMGVVIPQAGFLQGLRDLCDAHGALLVFDEVMSGFRTAPGGVQQQTGVKPDLTTLGKIIGGGFPVGAYGGRRDLMEKVAPLGPVYQAGTLSGNPVAMAAGLAMLRMLQSDPTLYDRLTAKTQAITRGIGQALTQKNIPFVLNEWGSMFTFFFTADPVTDYPSAKKADTARFASFHQHLLSQGVYLPPSQFEAAFVSDAIGDAEVNQIIAAAESWPG